MKLILKTEENWINNTTTEVVSLAFADMIRMMFLTIENDTYNPIEGNFKLYIEDGQAILEIKNFKDGG